MASSASSSLRIEGSIAVFATLSLSSKKIFCRFFLAEAKNFCEIESFPRRDRAPKRVGWRDIEYAERGFGADAGDGEEEFKKLEIVFRGETKEIERIFAYGSMYPQRSRRTFTKLPQHVSRCGHFVSDAARAHNAIMCSHRLYSAFQAANHSHQCIRIDCQTLIVEELLKNRLNFT